MTGNLKEALYSKIPLRFSKEGKYKILMVSDIHGGKGYDEERTVKALDSLIEAHKPDLVLLGGDTAGPGMIHVETKEDLKTLLDGVSSPMEKRGIPWAHVYGNHDNNYGLPNEAQQPIYEAYQHCVSKAGPKELTGCGNFVLPIYDSEGAKICFNIFGFDSNHSEPEFKKDFGLPQDTRFYHAGSCADGDYDGVRFDQIMWYYQTSIEMEKHNGSKIPALAFMHIPIPELAMGAADRTKFHYKGFQGENVACSILNYGFFAAALQRGDIKAMCFSHDHHNDFSMNYAGIELSYDGFLSYHACHDNHIRGGRIFEIDASKPFEIKSYMVRVRDILGESADSF